MTTKWPHVVTALMIATALSCVAANPTTQPAADDYKAATTQAVRPRVLTLAWNRQQYVVPEPVVVPVAM